MSRVAKAPVRVPAGVQVTLEGQEVQVKGPKGTLERSIHRGVEIRQEGGELVFAPRGAGGDGMAQAGTARALLACMVQGVSEGFERRLQLVGVGYRAQMQGTRLNLSLGFSHPVVYEAPEGITIEAPTQTEVVVRGIDKQRVGQTAAVIRAFRPPEPYKGKGVKYADEVVVRKEAKKK